MFPKIDFLHVEHSFTLFIYNFFLQGLSLLELAAHLEGKAVQFRWEGFGKIKITVTVTDTSSLLQILEGCFGYNGPGYFSVHCFYRKS